MGGRHTLAGSGGGGGGAGERLLLPLLALFLLCLALSLSPEVFAHAEAAAVAVGRPGASRDTDAYPYAVGGEPMPLPVPPLPADSTFSTLEEAAAAAAAESVFFHSADGRPMATTHHFVDSWKESGREDDRGTGGGGGAAVAAPSQCSASSGCPHSSMVWASGSFTFPELLTPSTFLVDANATLQLSLCCDYQYDGEMLREPELYRVFLHELLQASPFQVLTDEEKLQLFPRGKAFIVSADGKRVYRAQTVFTDGDLARRNPGGGSVLVLATGKLTISAVSRVFSSAASTPLYLTNHPGGGGERQHRCDSHARANSSSLAEGAHMFRSGRSGSPASLSSSSLSSSSTTASADASSRPWAEEGKANDLTQRVNLLSTDIQLRVSNRVLRCKCPHTLLVMPLLRLRPDRLPSVEILGVGPHCSQRPATGATAVTPFRHVLRIANSSKASATSSSSSSSSSAASPARYATTFMVSPPLPPATEVIWTVRSVGAGNTERAGGGGDEEKVVLRHRHTLPVVVVAREAEEGAGASVTLSHAASPYMEVEPNTLYEVHVRVTRVGGRLCEEAQGLFVLREPFHRSWPLPPLDVRPHFGFHRQLRLNRTATLTHPEVAHALLPKKGLSVTAREAVRFNYYGYWESTPLRDQPVPQHGVRKKYNPFARGSLQDSGVAFPLSLGRNTVAYYLRDVDEVCGATQLEEREYWAVQAIIATEGPTTACGPAQDVEAVPVRDLLRTMRESKRFAVSALPASGAPLADADGAGRREGNYRCRRRRWMMTRAASTQKDAPAAPTMYDGECEVTTTFPEGIRGTTARLHLQRRGVYDVEWILSVDVADPALLMPDDLDAAYAEVHAPAEKAAGGEQQSHTIVRVRSRIHHVVRRVASYPSRVPLQLPMHARRFRVPPPSPLPVSESVRDGADSGNGKGRGRPKGGSWSDSPPEEMPTGYWVAHSPLRTRSVDERLTLELDTSGVPNVQQTLPNATLLYVAQDLGEDLSLAYGIAYTSRCPDTFVEYTVSVVAMHAPPIVPAFVSVYTEEDCVVLEPPRMARKDEVVEWRVRDCAEAGLPPHIVERVVSSSFGGRNAAGEGEADPAQLRDVVKSGGGGRGGGGSRDDGDDGDAVMSSRTAPAKETMAVVTLACGIEVYKRCEVEWTATNLVATVRKTYSLRRCQRPPEILFHKNGLQQRVGTPSSSFVLPSVYEAYYHPEGVGGGGGGGGGPEGASASRPMERTRLRSILPIAGYASDVGYSFNYSAGSQDSFEAVITPLHGEAANALLHTQIHSPYPAPLHNRDAGGAVGAIHWRHRIRYDVSTAVLSSDRTGKEGSDGDGVYEHASHHFLFGDRNGGFYRPFPPAKTKEGVVDDDVDVEDDEEGEEDDEDLLPLSAFWPAYGSSPDEDHERQDTREGPPNAEGTRRSPAQRYARRQVARLERLARRRNAAIDAALNEHFRLVHSVSRRELLFQQLANSSLYPMDYLVRPSTKKLPSTAALEEDRREFQRRNMCVARSGYTALLALSPLGVVAVEERRGQPRPLPPAVAVLPFCSPKFIFSRHPHLHQVYGYDFTWECEDSNVIAAQKFAPTYSVLSHVGEERGGTSPGQLPNETRCQLTVRNDITDTVKGEWFLVRRVYPSPPRIEHFTVLSGNAASLPSGGEQRHHPPHQRRQTLLTRRVYGKSVVLHVDHPSSPRHSYWEVLSVVPAVTGGEVVRTQAWKDAIRFVPLPRHPGALARGKGGSTALVTGLDNPGVYTIAHVMPDPGYPSLCPNTTFVEPIEVLRAQVKERELYVCGGTAALRAVPIPKELASEFVGAWEVVSLQTAEDELWTSGVNFTGIRFEHGKQPDTLVHGLPFGIVTIRWSIYKLLPAHDEGGRLDPSAGDDDAHPSPRSAPLRTLVDHDTVRVMVLTENLHTHRLVTLADTAVVLTTSSTLNWHIAAEHYAADWNTDVVYPGDTESRGGAESRLLSSSSSSSSSRKPLLRQQPLLNYSYLAFGDAAPPVVDPLPFPYHGPSPRPGTSLLTVSPLPVGSLHLGYTLVPSVNLFGPMIGHTCELQGAFTIERVSAFLSAETSLDHECDGYTGDAEVTLCLHAKTVAPPKESAPRKGKTSSSSSGSRSSSSGRQGAAGASGGGPSPREAAWESRLRLVDPSSLEAIVKGGAMELERAGCVTPWWVWPSARWRNTRFVSTPTMPIAGRCVAFRVTAGRHLAPREVSHPLFLATPARAKSDGGGAGGGRTRSATATGPHGQRRRGGLASSNACGLGDFISSRVIDGTWDGSRPSVRATQTKDDDALGGSRTDLFSRLHHIGGESGHGPHKREQPSWWGMNGGERYLPILHADTLRRHSGGVGMRPMLGQQGLPDEVTLETDVSQGNESVVTLRLDLSQPRQLGGYVAYSSSSSSFFSSSSVNDTGDTSSSSLPLQGEGRERPPILLAPTRLSLLLACVEGSVRAGDVLQYWVEANRPDGAVDHTAEEWIEYVQAVKDTAVPCNVLFVSLQHLLAKAQKAAVAAVGGGGGSPLLVGLPGSGNDEMPSTFHHRGAVVTTTEGHRMPSRSADSGQLHLVPLDVVEQQLEGIQRESRRTKDGIDVTGLRGDLQEALYRRRVTKSQLREIEEVRRLRREQMERDEDRRARSAVPGNGNRIGDPTGWQRPPAAVSPKERLLEALKLYRRVAAAGGGEHREVVAAIRIRLPRYDPFVVPYNLFLRTALHKDVICGTNISASVDLRSPLVAVPPPNVYSTVPMGRVEVVDLPAAVVPHPPTVKQCEVEGSMPVLSLNVTGARYAAESFSAKSVFLEEVPNPDLPEHLRTSRRRRSPDEDGRVGLTPCVPELAKGMEVVVARATKKQLFLRLDACPAFRMLAPEEYNEHQDTEELLQRLKYPRLLRVTVRNALKSDSFTASRGGGKPVSPPPVGGGAVHSLNSSTYGFETSSAMPVVASTQQQQQQQQQPFSQSSLGSIRTSLDVTFVVPVVPTLALLHLHSGRTGAESARLGYASPPSHPTGLGSWGSGDNGHHLLRGGFRGNSARPLVLCERDMRRNGFELGVQLLGDHWTTPVGEVRADDYPPPPVYTAAAAGGEDRGLNRGAANVALLNSFSVVEHYTLESAHHLYLKGAAVYRSSFVHYLFYSILGNENVLRNHRFIRRYNSTFVGIAVPPQPPSPSRQGGGGGGGGSWRRSGAQQERPSQLMEDVDPDAVGGWWDAVPSVDDVPHHYRSRGGDGAGSYGSRSPKQSTAPPFQLPPVRRFSKIEEILFAVPGISTECRGCLLADTTFFVAGDLTGLWSFPGYGGRGGTAAAGASPLPTTLPPLDNAILARPLVLPWHEASAIPRAWQLHWMCPSAANAALTAYAHLWESVRADYRYEALRHHHPGQPTDHDSSPAALGDATLHMEVVVYTAHDTAGADLPSSRRLVSLLKSEEESLAKVLTSGSRSERGLLFRVREAAAEAAFTAVAADYLRYRRPAGRSRPAGLAPEHRYHREERYANGLAVLNASAVLKLCVPLPRPPPPPPQQQQQQPTSSSPLTSCMVVSVTDGLLTVEPPRAPRSPGFLWKCVRVLLGLSSSSGSGRESKVTHGGPAEEAGRAGRPQRDSSFAVFLHNFCLAALLYLALPLLSVEAARLHMRRRDAGGGGHSHRDAADRRGGGVSRVRAHLSFSSLLSGSSFVEAEEQAVADGADLAREAAAYEARVAVTVVFLLLMLFAYNYVPLAWVAAVLALWSYVLYKAKDALVLLLFVCYVVYWYFAV